MLALLKKIPGGLMIVPLVIGALLHTIDEAHLPWMQDALAWLGAPGKENPETGETSYELLKIGGFATALTGSGATTLIAMFLVCVAAQMNFRIGGRALKKGAIITTTKLAIAVGCGYGMALLFDPFTGLLGLSLVSIVAAMSNGNGGLYLALTGQYGDRSDVGAVAVISLNDGPFFTLLALGMMGEQFPFAAFLAVLLPMLVGFLLGQWSEEIRVFLSHGEKLCIPFFAFALGTTMSFATFLNLEVLAGGLLLGLATVVLTGLGSAVMLRILGEQNVVAAFAEASTAGNAVQTPFYVAVAAAGAASLGVMATERADAYQAIVGPATAQVSISVMTTALLCPLAVVLYCRWKQPSNSMPNNG